MKSLLDKVKQVYNSVTGTSTNTIGTMTTGTSTGTLTVNNPNYYGMGGNVGIGTTSTYSTWNTDDVNTATRKLKRRLWAIQHNKTWTHEMNDEMFESVCGMLQSEIKADNEVAKEIIFNSKMCLKYRKYFANNFRYKLEPSKFEKMGFNSITGGHYYTTSINSGYYSTTNIGTITTSSGTGVATIASNGSVLISNKPAKY
jgi:hypothetical protein